MHLISYLKNRYITIFIIKVIHFVWFYGLLFCLQLQILGH